MSILGDLGSALFGALYDFRIPIAVASAIAVVLLAIVARQRGWVGSARRHPGRTVALGISALAIAVPLAWYMASPLFVSSTVDEPAPIAAASSAPSAIASAAPASASPSASRAPAASATPAPLALAGEFQGSDEFHFGRGTARLIETAPGEFIVRLENFAVRNGPDLYVYLSPSADGYTRDSIELGRLKADTGNQNYAVPAGSLTDPAAAASVVIWCKQFSHLFATAPLAAG